jgi:hypothetical protein
MRTAEPRSERDAHRGYRFSYLARKYGLSQQDARELISCFGQDRPKLNAAARDILLKRQSFARDQSGTPEPPCPAERGHPHGAKGGPDAH